MPTITEIANHAGVSRTSVWLALNDRSGISDDMRQRILDARSQLVSVEGVQKKKGGSEAAVSVLILHSALVMSTEYFKRLLNGIQTGCDRHHFQMRLAAFEASMPPQHITNLYFSDPDLYPDGVIYLGSGMLEDVLMRSESIDIPLIEIGVPFRRNRTSYVAPDEEAAGYLAASHLIKQGHRRIAVLGHQVDAPHLQQRIDGYRRALLEQTQYAPDDWLFVIEGQHTSFEEEKHNIEIVTQQFINDQPDVTAVLFTNWQASEIALPMLLSVGYCIPDDLSVIVFDNFEHARHFEPPLTAINYPLEAMGMGAVKLLADKLNDPHIKRNQAIYDVELIRRASCRLLTQDVVIESK